MLKSSFKQLFPGASARKSNRKREQRTAQKLDARRERFESDAWRRSDGVSRLAYEDYDAYVAHQASKLDEIYDRLSEREERDRAMFLERFRGCAAIGEGGVALCLGARLGSEVAALHALGFFAVGIDLNPGPDNLFVLPGDFHNVVFPESTVDVVYCNALDHSFDLEKLLSEVRRLLKPGGIFLVDLLRGAEEGCYPGDYESLFWANADAFAEKIAEVGRFTLESRRDLPDVGANRFVQVVLRKPGE